MHRCLPGRRTSEYTDEARLEGPAMRMVQDARRRVATVDEARAVLA